MAFEIGNLDKGIDVTTQSSVRFPMEIRKVDIMILNIPTNLWCWFQKLKMKVVVLFVIKFLSACF